MNSQTKSPIGLYLKKIWKKFEWIFYLVEIFLKFGIISKNLEEKIRKYCEEF